MLNSFPFPHITAPVDHGSSAPDSGAPGTAHTYNTKTATGPFVAVFVSWHSGSSTTRTLSSATWNAVGCPILVQVTSPATGTERSGCAWIRPVLGAQSGNIVLTFSGSTADSYITILSVPEVLNTNLIDTDSTSGSGASIALTALASPGNGGIRLVGMVNEANATAVTWTNATEVADVNVASFHRHAAAYDLGDDSGTITGDGGTDDQSIVGVAYR